MKLFVTGGTGFIGSHLIQKLSEKNHEIIVLSRRSHESKEGITHVKGNILDTSFKSNLLDSLNGNSFPKCYTCTLCTSSCPVVNNFDKPLEALGLLPHQIIHAAKIELADMIFRSRMLWSCLGCYKCQDACPQGVRITEVFYELKNMAATGFNRNMPESVQEEI